MSASPVTSSTVSLTRAKLGAFVLRNLPTPGTFTVVVTAPGYASQTLSVALAQAEELTGLSVILTRGSGSIDGKVALADGSPLGDVTVTVSGGPLSITTETLSKGKGVHGTGTYQFTGLPVPGTYEVAFSGPGLQPETREVVLVPPGTTTPSLPGTTSNPNHLDVVMQLATAAHIRQGQRPEGRRPGGYWRRSRFGHHELRSYLRQRAGDGRVRDRRHRAWHLYGQLHAAGSAPDIFSGNPDRRAAPAVQRSSRPGRLDRWAR